MNDFPPHLELELLTLHAPLARLQARLLGGGPGLHSLGMYWLRGDAVGSHTALADSKAAPVRGRGGAQPPSLLKPL